MLIHIGNGYAATVDDTICPIVNIFRWHWSGRYVCTTLNNKERRHLSLRLHHIVLQPKDGYVVDHINGNTLDNRSANLRHLTKSLNGLNRQTPRGVKTTRNGKYEARVSVEGKYIHLGTFTTYDEALEARQAWENQLWQR